MKILFISTRLPHARVVSGHIIVHQRIKRLAERGYQVGLAAFERAEDRPYIAEMHSLLSELELVPPPPRLSPLQLTASYFFSRVPGRFRIFRSEAMRRCVGDMVERSGYDVVIAEFASMGPYLFANPYLPAVRKIISVHQCYTIVSRKRLDVLGRSLSALGEWFAFKRLRRYEFAIYRHMDRVLVLTPEERYGLLQFAPELHVAVVPSGVDVDYYRPAEIPAQDPAILFTGYYSDEQNRDAVFWFCRTVWPILKAKYPRLVFYVVGPEPTGEMLDLQRKDPQIKVTGTVDDIRIYLAKAQVFVCPIRMGSGLRGKIFEAMASGVPVVSTTLGAAGIAIQMGENGFLADKPQIMAQQIDLLLSDARLRNVVADSARAMVASRFSWDRGIDLLEKNLVDVVNQSYPSILRKTEPVPVISIQ